MSAGLSQTMLDAMSAPPTPIERPDVAVFIAAAHPSVRRALWTLLECEPHVEPAAMLANLADLRRLLERVAPPVVIVDDGMLGRDGIAALPGLVVDAPAAAFIVVGMGEHPSYVRRAREAGATDYVRLDDAERLTVSVRAASEASAPFAAGAECSSA
jgi:DNA-binding NarL/FixJ family response regulator